MLLGEMIHNASSTSVYTAPISRGGKTGMFSVDVTQLEGTATLAIEIQQKNQADTTWTSKAAFTNITAIGMGTKQADDVQEQVRLKFDVTGGASAWVRIQFLPIAWTN